MNKVWIVLVSTLFYWKCVLASAITLPLTAIPEVSLDAGNYETADYSTFLSNLRGKLKSDIVSYSIPVLPVTVKVDSDNRYVLAKLKSGASTTTVILDVLNAYVLGFIGDKKAFFFKDVAGDIYDKSKLIFGVTKQDKLPYGGGYQALHIAGAGRENVPLGISMLNNAIFQLDKYSKTDDPKKRPNVASSLLVVIQMISEAARFKYIEQKLVDKVDNIYPKGDILTLENNWEALSAAIQTSKNGVFAPIQLKDENYKPFTVSTVKSVQDKMGLLKAKANINSLCGIKPLPDSGDLVNKQLSMS